MTAVGHDLHATVEASLRSVGQRYTAEAAGARHGSWSAPTSRCRSADCWRARTGLPQSSVYRNLAVLEQAGVVRRVITEGEFARFELDRGAHRASPPPDLFELRQGGGRHDPADLESTMDRTVDRRRATGGFAQVRHRLDLIGTCRSCARAWRHGVR